VGQVALQIWSGKWWKSCDEDITMLNTHTPRPFPCWTSSPTQLPRPSRIQPTLTHGFGDNSIIRRRNKAYKYSLERGWWRRRFGSSPSSRSRVYHSVWPRQGAAPPTLGQLGHVSSRALGPSRSRRRFRCGFFLEFLSSNSRRYRFVKPQLICRVNILRAASFEFLLVFFISQAGISLRGEVNWIVTRLITRGIVVLRLQGSRSLVLKPDRASHPP
jgi:hypothetical protein